MLTNAPVCPSVAHSSHLMVFLDYGYGPFWPTWTPNMNHGLFLDINEMTSFSQMWACPWYASLPGLKDF